MAHAGAGTAEMTTLVREYEPAYYDDLERCVERVQDIDARFPRSRPWRRRLRRDDPLAVRLAAIDAARRGLAAAGSGALSERLADVGAALRRRGGGR